MPESAMVRDKETSLPRMSVHLAKSNSNSSGASGLGKLLGCSSAKAVSASNPRSTTTMFGSGPMKIDYKEGRLWGSDLKRLMENRIGRNLLHAYLESEHADMNLQFWEQIEAFRYQRTEKDRGRMAKEIFDKFIGESADCEVPLDAVTVRELDEMIKGGQVTPEMFDEAQRAIYVIMKQGSFHRFSKSKIYWDYLVTLVTKQDVQAWGNSFESIVNHDVGRYVLAEYLTSEYADENIRFWEEVQDYKMQATETERAQKAKQIYKRFLHPDSKTEVSVDYKTHQQIQHRMGEGPVDLFDDAEKVAYHSMHRDNYPRFIASSTFKQFIASFDQQNK